MATNNTIKLAEDVLSAVKHFKGELTAEGCRQALGKSYFFHGGLELGDFQCSPRGVKLIPKGEDFMDLTWSKFIKFCHENGLMEEATTLCNPKPATSTDVAATAADPAAASPAATSTTWESAADAAASTPGSWTEPTQPSPSGHCSPAECGTAAPLACAPDAPATATAGFDYSGLDLPTVDTLHLAERMIADARRDYVTKLAQAVYIAHDALCGGGCDKLSQAHNNQHSEKTFGAWCTHVGISRKTGERLLQVAGLLNGATPEEQAVLEAASPSLLYAAAKPSAPAQLVQGVKDGDITTHKQYQELLAQLKAKEQELADEKAAHEAESRACSELLADEQQRRQAANEARIAAEKTAQEAKESCRTARKALDAARDQLRTQTARVKELEDRPIEVRGADPDDIARWRAEGAEAARAELDKARRETAALQDRLAELEAGPAGGDAVALARQAAAGVETILQGQFALLDALPYDTYEAAAAPYEALRDRLTTALELGRWPEQ